MALLQACHHGLTGDSAKLIGEGAVENQDVHREDPLADGCGVLQGEALVNEEDAALEDKLRMTNGSCRDNTEHLSSLKQTEHSNLYQTDGLKVVSDWCVNFFFTHSRLTYNKDQCSL